MIPAFSALITLVLCHSSAVPAIPADYKAYLDALSAQSEGRYPDVIELINQVFRTKPVSPLNGKAAIIAARAYLSLSQFNDAVKVLRRFNLPQPEGAAILGEALEAAGDQIEAAATWQKVYYEYPLADEATLAEAALLRLVNALGNNYPPAMPQSVLGRAEKLRRSGQAARAKKELLAAAPSFGGVDRELALVRANQGDYAGLTALTVTQPDAEAERLYLMHAAARRSSQDARAEAALNELVRRFPTSGWTREALTSWGNHFLVRNDVAQYEPLYTSCADKFTDDYCHWKVTWSAWINRRPDAKTRMATYVARFPDGDKAAAAMYFLGRYEEVIARYPMSWYAVLSRPKAEVPVAARSRSTNFNPSGAMKYRITRARQLETANLHEWAEFELRYAANEQPFVAAMELAEVAAGRGAHDQALRYIKGVAKGYLALAPEEAPERFWKLAFPLPYRTELEQNSRLRGLDKYLVAALIRQESEFNPLAVSSAKAYGLTQVLPSTGRSLSRRVGITGFRTSMLFNPEYNLRLGTYYLRTMLDSHGGKEEVTLASYNAGKSRSDLWLSWYDYREPAEFVETVPFSETRGYIQTVLRNADMYRRLYKDKSHGTSAD